MPEGAGPAPGGRPTRAAFETIPCPVCGGHDFEHLFEKAGEPFVRCRGCTLVLINPRPRAEDVALTYDAAYSRGYIDKAERKLARCRRWVRRVARLRGHAGGRWLDVGCSAGFVLAAAREAGFEVSGVELEAAAVAFAQETLQLPAVTCGTLEAQAYPAASFDVVTLYDVIEHVPDLNRTVAELARILKPGGVLEIRTPDVAHWSRPRALARWREIKPSEHLYYFSPATLERLLARHGLQLRCRRLMWKAAIDAFFTRAT